jgi:hypothetical protein
LVFWNRVSLCSPGWPQTCDHSAFFQVPNVLGLQACNATSSSKGAFICTFFFFFFSSLFCQIILMTFQQMLSWRLKQVTSWVLWIIMGILWILESKRTNIIWFHLDEVPSGAKFNDRRRIVVIRG